MKCGCTIFATIPDSNHHEVPPGFSKNRGHLSEHRIEWVTEPRHTALKHQEDSVGVAELIVQYVHHFLYSNVTHVMIVSNKGTMISEAWIHASRKSAILDEPQFKMWTLLHSNASRALFSNCVLFALAAKCSNRAIRFSWRLLVSSWE